MLLYFVGPKRPSGNCQVNCFVSANFNEQVKIVLSIVSIALNLLVRPLIALVIFGWCSPMVFLGTNRYCFTNAISCVSSIIALFSNSGIEQRTKRKDSKFHRICNTPSPRITGFPLARFPLTRILVYVRASGGILCQLNHQYSPTNAIFTLNAIFFKNQNARNAGNRCILGSKYSKYEHTEPGDHKLCQLFHQQLLQVVGHLENEINPHAFYLASSSAVYCKTCTTYLTSDSKKLYYYGLSQFFESDVSTTILVNLKMVQQIEVFRHK